MASRRRPSTGRNPEARQDNMLADAIDIGLIYWDVFGTNAARHSLTNAGVEARIVERVLTGLHRGWALVR